MSKLISIGRKMLELTLFRPDWSLGNPNGIFSLTLGASEQIR